MRSPGDAENKATRIGPIGDGNASIEYDYVNSLFGVRPGIWIKPQLCAGTTCPEGQHKYGDSCEPDDENNCGRHGKKCTATQFSHATAAACQMSNCTITSCDANYHVNAHGICVTCKADEQWNENTKSCERIVAPVDCAALVKNLKVGDTLTFGQYLQTTPVNEDDGPEPIEWRVLDINNENGVLITSKYALSVQKYNLTDGMNVTKNIFPKSALRSWLNGLGSDQNANNHDYSEDNFINAAFDDNQLKCIQTVTRTYDKDTTASDKIFILTKDEATDYFSSDTDRILYSTDYMTSKYWLNIYYEGYCTEGRCMIPWWLSSISSTVPYYVEFDGRIDGSLYLASPQVTQTFGVRPTLWLKK